MSDERDEDIFPMLENRNRMKPDEVLCPGDMDKIIAVARRRIAWNKVKYTEMSRWVNGDIGGDLINPEYVARAEATRELKNKLREYSGDAGVASDELFRIKVQADKEGKDFTQVCKEEIEKMKGNKIIAPLSEPVPVTLVSAEPELEQHWYDKFLRRVKNFFEGAP